MNQLAHQEVLNTHYNLFSMLMFLDPERLLLIGERVDADESLRSSTHASQLFQKWWDQHSFLFAGGAYSAVFSIWEIVYWAKTMIDEGGQSWWDRMLPAIKRDVELKAYRDSGGS